MAQYFNTRIQHKRGTEEQWRLLSFVPLDGELIIYSPDVTHENARFKIGDGKKSVNELSFVPDPRIPEAKENESGYVLQVKSDGSFAWSSDFQKSIIALSVDGKKITYICADGTSNSFETQDENTEYFLATETETGLTKLYATIGFNEDGTMTQKAITEALNTKVGVKIDSNTLIFTI